MLVRNMLVNALLLGLFATLGTALVSTTYEGTAERIAQNEREALLNRLHVLVPPGRHDNDLVEDRIEVRDRPLLGSGKPLTVYRARLHGQPVAAVLTVIAPDGYGGPIKLLVAVNYDGRLAGVRVVSQRETPGLGDRIEADRSNWILGFDGRSLEDPKPAGWRVKKDGGVFDQFTGATITPRAVVKAVYRALEYYQQHRDALFAPAPAPEKEEPDHE